MPLLREVAQHVRSKNAGPFWVTVDIFFHDAQDFTRYARAPGLSAAAIAAALGVPAERIQRYEIESLSVLKISYPRLTPQGGICERDMHSGQGFVPLLDLQLEHGSDAV